MAMDIIIKAKERRDRLAAEIARLDIFLAMAAELSGDEGHTPRAERTVRATRRGASRGIGAETVAAAIGIVRDRGPQPTRDLLPMIKALGINVGGKSEIATLSARLSTSGKGTIEMAAGRWREAEQDKAPGPGLAPEREESADPSVEGRSADSLFNQAKEGRYAAALT
jgi:hypothetical protein